MKKKKVITILATVFIMMIMMGVISAVTADATQRQVIAEIGVMTGDLGIEREVAWQISSLSFVYRSVLSSGFFSFEGLKIPFVVACVITLSLFLAHNSIKKASAYHYEVKNSFTLYSQKDDFSHKNVTSRRLEKEK